MNQKGRAAIREVVQEALEEAQKGENYWHYLDYIQDEGEESTSPDKRLAQMMQVAHQEARKLGGKIEAQVNKGHPDTRCISLRPEPPSGPLPRPDTIPGLAITKKELHEIARHIKLALARNRDGSTTPIWYRFEWNDENPFPPPQHLYDIASVARHLTKIMGGELEFKLEGKEPDTLLIGLCVKPSSARILRLLLKKMRLELASEAGTYSGHVNLLGLVTVGILNLAVEAWADLQTKRLGKTASGR